MNRPTMTDAQKLKANKKILQQLQQELFDFKDNTKAIPEKYIKMFPTKDAAWIRHTMIRAREADVLNYQGIIESYEARLTS